MRELSKIELKLASGAGTDALIRSGIKIAGKYVSPLIWGYKIGTAIGKLSNKLSGYN